MKNSFRLLSELYSLLFKKCLEGGQNENKRKFPSPLGVIFSLIVNLINSTLDTVEFVSVSSRSYILSYTNTFYFLIGICYLCFRLLSELYSLLYIIIKALFTSLKSFRLLSELYSLLYYRPINFLTHLFLLVSVSSRSYILSYIIIQIIITQSELSFRLLSELYSLL